MPSNAPFITFEMPVTIVERTPEIPSVLKFSFSDVKKSPIRADISRSRLPRLANPSDPISCPIGLRMAAITFLPMSKIEKKPLKVRLILSAVSPLILSLEVNSFSLAVKLASCFPVVEGNISLNASLIGATIDPIPSHVFQKDSMRSSLPPRSFHSRSISFRASPPEAKTSHIALARSVQSSVASFWLPNMISNVFIQPVLTASFTESTASPQVLAS